MAEPINAIPTGGDDQNDLQELSQIPAAGELPSTNPDTSDALDALLKKSTEDAPAPEPTEEEKAAAQKKADEDVAAKAAADAQTDEEKAAAETKRLADEAAAKEKSATDFDAVELPPHAKPKTTEAFSIVKERAKAALKIASEKVAAAEARAKELEEKTKSALTPELQKELDELRAFRQKLDVEADPQFRTFDETVKSNDAAILAKLKTAGLADEAIAKIKEIGVAEVDWEPVFGKLPSQVRRYIESKLVENEDLGEKKKAAIEKAKANSTEFLKTREQSFSKQSEEFTKTTKAKVDEFMPRLEWLKDKAIPADAKPEDKKGLEAHNEFVAHVRKTLDETVADNSPEMKSILVVGYAQLLRTRADLANLQESTKAQIEGLTKERDEAQSLLKRVKGASTTRLRESSAPQKGDEGSPKPKVDYSEPTTDALDRHLKDVLATKE